MKPTVYQDLLTVMQSRRGPYAGLDIPEFYALVKVLFTLEEAKVNNILARQPETLEQIAQRLNRDPKGLLPLLEAMAGKGLCATFVRDDERVFKGLPFMPGIFEYQFIAGSDTANYRKLARLIHMSRNTTEEIEFLCNCDRWHCEVVTHVLKQPKPGWVFNSGYQPLFYILLLASNTDW